LKKQMHLGITRQPLYTPVIGYLLNVSPHVTLHNIQGQLIWWPQKVQITTKEAKTQSSWPKSINFWKKFILQSKKLTYNNIAIKYSCQDDMLNQLDSMLSYLLLLCINKWYLTTVDSHHISCHSHVIHLWSINWYLQSGHKHQNEAD